MQIAIGDTIIKSGWLGSY